MSCATGEVDWGEVYARFYRPLFGFALRNLQHRDDAQDLVSDIFVKAISVVPRAMAAPFGTDSWMWKIARNALIDHYRRARSRVASCLDDTPDLVEEAPTLQEQAEAAILCDTLRRAIAALAPGQAEAIVYHANGYGQVEAGEILGVATGTIKSRVNRAQDTLHKNPLVALHRKEPG